MNLFNKINFLILLYGVKPGLRPNHTNQNGSAINNSLQDLRSPSIFTIIKTSFEVNSLPLLSLFFGGMCASFILFQ